MFLEHGVALIGPGDAGAWRQGRDDADFDGSAVRRFATEVRPGDVFLLRTAANRIAAIGLVASGYLFLDQFLGSPPSAWQTTPLPHLRQGHPRINDIPGPLTDIVAQVADLVPLYQDASRFGNVPTEEELVAHLVMPFLKALGWPAELIGIKWRYVDVMLFRCLPRVPENCHLIVEAKRLGTGVEAALKQAQR